MFHKPTHLESCDLEMYTRNSSSVLPLRFIESTNMGLIRKVYLEWPEISKRSMSVSKLTSYDTETVNIRLLIITVQILQQNPYLFITQQVE